MLPLLRTVKPEEEEEYTPYHDHVYRPMVRRDPAPWVSIPLVASGLCLALCAKLYFLPVTYFAPAGFCIHTYCTLEKKEHHFIRPVTSDMFHDAGYFHPAGCLIQQTTLSAILAIVQASLECRSHSTATSIQKKHLGIGKCSSTCGHFD